MPFARDPRLLKRACGSGRRADGTRRVPATFLLNWARIVELHGAMPIEPLAKPVNSRKIESSAVNGGATPP